MTIQERLNQSPPKKILKDNGGGQFLPIEWVEQELDDIFGTENWSTKWAETPALIAPNVISCGVELYVEIEGKVKVLTGTALDILELRADGLPVAGSVQYRGKSIKSIAVVNAARMLGKRFGRFINRGVEHDTAQFKAKIIN